MARIRSPNYPQIELSDAIILADTIHKKEGTNFTSREALAELLGYSSVNGASDKKIGAMTAYGLLERNADRELRVSKLALSILHPESLEEKIDALMEAVTSPNLFREIKDKWPDTPPSDASLKSYLIRNNFNQNSVEQVISVFRSATALADPEKNGHTVDTTPSEDPVIHQKESVMQPMVPIAAAPQKGAKPIVFDMETISGSYSFDNADDLEDFIEKLNKIKALLPSKH